MSDYVVSARKYRPDSFESLIGQDNIAKTLKNSILRGQLAHAYLFCGPRGVGKTSAARIFAKTINCSDPGADLEPCGHCESCLSFQEGRSYCIHELDAASNNGVDDIKALMDQVQIPPQVGRYSVYIIDEVHMLSQSAFNAFLKTLEERPAHAIFILATTEKHKIIPTILSRCQTYDFNRISVPDIVRNLRGIAGKENISIDDESLHVIAHKADGAMRDALTIFDQTVAFCGTDIHYEDVIRNLNVLDYDYSFKLVDAFLTGDYATALLTFDEILRKGFNALHFVTALSSHFRDLLVSRTGGLDSLLDLPESLKARYQDQAGRCSVKFLYDALTITTQCEAGYRASANQRLHIEYSLMKLAFASAGGPPVHVATGGHGSVDPTSVGQSRAGNPSGETSSPASQPMTPPPTASAVPPLTEPRVAMVSRTGSGTALTTPSSGPASAPVVADEPVALDVEPEKAPEKPARRAPKKGASLSLSSLMEDEDELTVMPADEAPEAVAAVVLPGDELVAEKWKELAAAQTAQPRLANAMACARLDIREEGGTKIVEFAVTNEAQKKWIEERILRTLENQFSKLLDCPHVRLIPTVVPEEQQEERKYMPAEKAQDLLERNAEVRALVTDLGLDIK